MSDSQHLELRALVHAKFRETFGDPTASLGGGEQWSIQISSSRTPIHVLLNGLSTGPSVWVFDPTDSRAQKAATHVSVKGQADLDQIIADIRGRMAWGRERSTNSKRPVSEQKSFDSPAAPDEPRFRHYNQDNPRLPE